MSSPEFESLRTQLQQSRQALDANKETLFLAREKLKQVEARQARLARHFDAENDAHAREQERLKAQHAGITRTIDKLSEGITGLEGRLLENLEVFLPLTDPRERVESLSDIFPVLLLPLRIETRFKQVVTPNGTQHQLWVRVFPDDCSVDTFEAALSETEVRNAQTLWAQLWRAGDDDAQRRAAWRNLVGSHGTGRAMWIIQQYRPVNEADQPTIDADALLLVIATDSPLDPSLQAPVNQFWTTVWKAGADAVAIQAAQDALVAQVGADVAQTVVEDYRPFNLSDPPPAGLDRESTTVQVATVVFESAEDTATKRRAWSKAPRVNIMPERLVLMGYVGGTRTLEVVGNAIPSPLIVGPDPLAEEGDQIRQEDAEIVVSADMQWMVDFNAAVAQGMGFRVNLTPGQFQQGFDTLMVLGVRLSSDEQAGRQLAGDLFTGHHYSRAGLSLLKQGTPTNNTDDNGAGYSATDDADLGYDVLTGDTTPLETGTDWFDRPDGRWLADLLGLDVALFRDVPGALRTDVRDAQAMNIALFPATLGYTLDTMLSSVFSDRAVEFVRQFFTRFVSGRGLVPALRIGRQPYGILPTTVYSRMQFGRVGADFTHGFATTHLAATAGSPFLAKLYEVLMRAYGVWGNLRGRVAHVGQTGGDPHQILLDVLGLHATSVEFDQRYAESLEQVLNSMNLQGIFEKIIVALGLLNQGLDILRDHGYNPDELGRPDLLNKFFFQKPYALDPLNLIDDQPLSEADPVRVYTPDGRNYLQWLIDAANTSLETLRLQNGFSEGDRPTALLYIMLRHALMLGYYDTSIRLYERAEILTPEQLRATRTEAPFIHVQGQKESSESRFKLLYDAQPVITDGPADLSVADYIVRTLPELSEAARLREQIDALDKLKDRSTAELERLFVEHIDTCSYRLDSWLQGLAHYQLAVMRYTATEGETARQGLYLGAYGWLENVRPENKVLTPVELADDALIEAFESGEEPPLVRDSTNAGYVHAPSLNHAVTAAILRNAYVSTASPDDAEVFAVNLSSDRVRRAMAVIEGLRNGQSLGALLGYQFERGLHDRHSLAEVDRFIYVLRDKFSLVANRLASTKTSEHDSITAIEARNVLDGEALANHIENASVKTYPYGLTGLPAPGTAAGRAVAAEMERLVDTNDAVSDLGIAEGIHQVAQGNYDRAAATLESLSSGDLPPIPDVVQTPRSGAGLTLRVGLHLKPGLSPTASPVGGLAMTPRASAEPALNDWLHRLLPLPDQVGVRVVIHHGDGTTSDTIITQAQLELQPLDLLYMLIPENEQAMTALDDLIVHHALAGLRPDAAADIRYTEPIDPQVSFFELGAMINQLRAIVLEARPLRSTDMALPLETGDTVTALPTYHTNRLTHVRDTLTAPAGALDDLRDLEAELALLLDDPEANFDNLVENIDARLARYVDALAALSVYGLPQTGFGAAQDWRRARYTLLLNKLRDLLDRWQTKLDTFDTMLADYGTLPPATTDEVRFEHLEAIEKQVVIVPTAPQPATPAAYEAILPTQRAAFVAKRDAFAALLGAPPALLADLLDDIDTASAGIETFDFFQFDLLSDAQEFARYSGDLHSHVQQVIQDIDARVLAATNDLADYATATTERARTEAFTHAAQSLLGEGFVVVPEFSLPAVQADEMNKAHAALPSLLAHQTGTLGVDFPVDDWLYGVARVRDMMHRWEALTMLAEAIKGVTLDLHPLQLPFAEGDSWLALPYPTDYTIDTDKLLYTAHYVEPFDKGAAQCGLLLDEWTEVIPTTDETTGITFHYDRPNAEPPQVMLLAVPPHINGKWEWADLVDTLHETLEMAKRRAVEPDHIASTDYARYLPATVSAVTVHPITIALNYAIMNNVYQLVSFEDNNA